MEIEVKGCERKETGRNTQATKNKKNRGTRKYVGTARGPRQIAVRTRETPQFSIATHPGTIRERGPVIASEKGVIDRISHPKYKPTIR